MAKITGALTGWKGKVGNLVFCMWKGIQVVKSRTIPVDKRSPNQLECRTVFSSVVKILRYEAIKFIRPFWNPFVTEHQSGWGNCISKNMLEQNNVFDISKLIFSSGLLEPLLNLSATYNSVTGHLIITWITSSFSNGLGSDHVSFICVLEDDEEVQFDEIDAAERDDESIDSTLPANLVASNIHIFLLTSKENPATTLLSLVSNSQHVVPTVP